MVKSESLTDRLDALFLGCLLAGFALWQTDKSEYVNNLTHANMPFKHVYPYGAPLVAIVGYVSFVLVFRPLYIKHWHPDSDSSYSEEDKKRRDDRIKIGLRLWNLFLAALSICMLAALIRVPYNSFQRGGVFEAVCAHTSPVWEKQALFWILIFDFSKYAELIDTVFLVLRNRPVAFLHWYHHWTVLAFTWFAVLWHFAPGFLFATVNSFVHTIMYWYYYRRACGVKLTYDRIITQIQLTQMVVGLVVTLTWVYFNRQFPDKCTADNVEMIVPASLIMYASYFALFASFYINRYLKGRKAAADSKKSS